MASKAARTARAARTAKDRWKAKTWYKIHAPGMLNFTPVSETLCNNPETLMGRVTKIPLQDITQDYRHKNVLVRLQVNQTKGYNLYTQYLGHHLTNDYIRLLTRRRHSKVEGIFTIKTNDGVTLRIKPMVITEKRIKTSQQQAIRNKVNTALNEFSNAHTLGELFHEINNGDLNRNLAKDVRKTYPTKRVEIRKVEVLQAPGLMETPPDPAELEAEAEAAAAAEAEEADSESETEGDVVEVTEAETPEAEEKAVETPEAEPEATAEEAEAPVEEAKAEEVVETAAEPETTPEPETPTVEETKE